MARRHQTLHLKLQRARPEQEKERVNVAMRSKANLRSVSVGLPFGMGNAEWQADDTEVRAAWSLYVELATRVAVEPLEADAGLLREALLSLHQLFPRTREILVAAGPSAGGRLPSVGGIAIAVLNKGLRPFLTKWHPELQEWEAQKPVTKGAREHELEFPRQAELRRELEVLQEQLRDYADVLAEIAGVKGA